MSQLPERRLSTHDFEMVIRRAAELQAGAVEEQGGEGVTEAELLRIGRELGLSPAHLTRALAEVQRGEAGESGALYRLFGAAVVRAERVVPGEAAEVRALVENYLLQQEYFRVKRRFPDRTVYEPATGVGAVLGRAANQVAGRSPALKVSVVEVAVQPVEEGRSYVSLSTSLAGQRAGMAAGAVLGGGGAGGAVAAVLGIAVAAPAALVGLPVAAGAYYGMRLIYGTVIRGAREQLESFLDRLEHGELTARAVRRFG